MVFSDFGDSALIFEALFWCRIAGGERELRLKRSDVRFRIDELFRENDITIAFPQQDVHLHPAGPLEFISRSQVDKPESNNEETS